MTITRTFTRDELEELGVPWESENVVHRMQVDEKRWATVHEAVFRTEPDGPLWLVHYYRAASELSEVDTWGYGFEPETVEAVQVEPYTVEVTRYREVAEP